MSSTSTVAPDHYAILGVADSAPHATIRSAYRRIMRIVHPDVAGDDPAATSRALSVNTAWAVLRDPVSRAAYDRARAGTVVPATLEAPASGMGGRPQVTTAQLREAAARESAYSALGREQRLAFSAASRRVGIMILLIGAVLLALVVAA